MFFFLTSLYLLVKQPKPFIYARMIFTLKIKKWLYNINLNVIQHLKHDVINPLPKELKNQNNIKRERDKEAKR